MKTQFLTCLFIIVSFSLQAQTQTLEDKVLDSIFRLKEVKQMSALIKKKSKGKHHLVLYVNEAPTKEAPYYWIKAWEDNKLAMVTVFDFLVYIKPFEIKSYDPAEDTAISLKAWRKQREKEQSK